MSELTNPDAPSPMPMYRLAGKLVSPLVFFIIFAIVQWIRMDGSAQFGLLDYYRYDLTFIPNDYKLIIWLSGISIGVNFILVLADSIERKRVNPFLLGILGVVPAFGNLITMLFLFYMIFYRGLWSLSELSSGFSFIPILKAIFFTGFGIAGYKAFSHLFQLRTLLNKGKIDEYEAYLSRYNLRET